MTTPTRRIPITDLEPGERMTTHDSALLVTAVTHIKNDDGKTYGVLVNFEQGTQVTFPVGDTVDIWDVSVR